MSTPAPTPGATTAPAPPTQGGQDAIVNQFAGQSPVGVGGKPNAAFTGNYGPFGGLRNQGEYQRGFGTAQTPITQSVLDLSNQYYSWSDDQKSQFRNSLSLIDKNAWTATDDQIQGIWSNYVQQSANYFSAGKSLSPWDILQKDIATRGTNNLGTTTTTERTDATLTGQADANDIFKAASQSLLGRNPTEQEYNDFKQSLNNYEKQNPYKSTVTTTTDAMGNEKASSQITAGGVTPRYGGKWLAEQQAMESPEYGTYQAATTYYNALMQMVTRGY